MHIDSCAHVSLHVIGHCKIMMIPVVDFNDCAVSISNDELGERHILSIAKEICDAFKTVGFVYLKNHGISAEKVNLLFYSPYARA